MTVMLISLKAQKLVKKKSPIFNKKKQKSPMTIQQYLSKITVLYLIGNARENSNRSDFKTEVSSIQIQ